MRWVGFAIPVSTALALLYIDSQFALSMARFDVISKATALELGVFVLQIGKTAAALVVREVREAPPGVLVDYYGAELLVLPFPAAYYFLTHSPWAIGVLSQITVGWMVGAAFATLPFVAYKLSAAMLRSGDLASVLPTGTVAAEVGLLFAGAGSSAKGGLDGLLVSALRGGGIPTNGEGPSVFAAVTFLFFCLLLYALVGKGTGSARAPNAALAIGALGTVACGGWLIGFSFLSSSLPLILGVPIASVVALSWWIGRAS